MTRTDTYTGGGMGIRWARWLPAAALTVTVTMGSTGCAQSALRSAITRPWSASPPVTAEEVYDACGEPGVVDYEPIESLSAMAADSTVVIRGTIDHIQSGRTMAYTDPTGVSMLESLVIVVRGAEVEAGALDPAGDGNVYIEFRALGTALTGSRPYSDCADLVPPGTAIVAYLEPAWDGTRQPVDGYLEPVDITVELTTPSAGRPAGQELYRPAALEGLIWQTPGSTEVIWPLYLGTGPGDIQDALPGGTLIGGAARSVAEPDETR